MGLVDVLMWLHDTIEEKSHDMIEEKSEVDRDELKSIHETLIKVRDNIDKFVRALLESGAVKEVVLGEIEDMAEEPYGLNHRWAENGIRVIPGDEDNISYLTTAISACLTKDRPASAITLVLENGKRVRIHA